MFSKTLRQLRKSKDLTQAQLGDAIFISSSAISQYENGHSRPSRDNLEALANFFNVSTDYLLGTSPIADLEEKLNQHYYADLTLNDFIELCLCIEPKHRESLCLIARALASHDDTQEK